jgi:hypothetical protein
MRWLSDVPDSRLDPNTYADDEPVRVASSAGSEAWVAERVWHRLWNLGRAYELHLVGVLAGGTDPVRLNAQQARHMLDELAFITAVVSADAAIATAVAMMSPVVREVAHGRADEMLTVEGP